MTTNAATSRASSTPARLDPVRSLLRDLGRCPVLDRAAEVALAHRIAAGGTDGEAARDELVRRNLRLVIAIARRYASSDMPLSDAVQEGTLGLIRAADGFDPAHGCRFSTYASWWVRQSIVRGVEHQAATVRVPSSRRTLARQVELARSQGRGRNGKAPSTAQIALQLHRAEAEVAACDLLPKEPLALDAPLRSDGDSTLKDILTDPFAIPPDVRAALVETEEAVRSTLSSLPPREEKVLRMRFGVGEAGASSLSEVGERLGISRERVRQIERTALRRLRQGARGDQLRAVRAA